MLSYYYETIHSSFLLSLLVVCTSCDPIEVLSPDGPKSLGVFIINESGKPIYERDNWGRWEGQQLYPSERTIKNSDACTIWAVDGLQTWEEFIGKLEESCPDAYVEIYDYNDSTREVGKLLRRWSLQDSISGHHFFNFESHHYDRSDGYIGSAGDLLFTLLPEDVE